MRILVTGNTGFLGRHLCRKLRNNYMVFVSNTKVNSIGSMFLENTFNQASEAFDVIIHLATTAKAGNEQIGNSNKMLLENSLLNFKILQLWREYCPDALFITMGTSCAYPVGIEMTEPHYLQGDVDPVLTGYAISKRTMLQYLYELADEEDNVRWSYLIPSTLYGTHFDSNDHHFIFDLIRKVADAKLMGNDSIEVWGSGQQIRSLIYVEDVVNIIQKVIDDLWYVDLRDSTLINTHTNLVGGCGQTIEKWVSMICKEMNYDVKIEPMEDIESGVPCRELVLNPDKHLTGPTTRDDYGIKQVVEWYMESLIKNV